MLLPCPPQALPAEALQAELIGLAAIFHAEANMREARRAVTLGELQRVVIAQARAEGIDPEMPLRALRAEVALELQLSEQAAAGLIDLGYQVASMPHLRQTWLDGLITRLHAKARRLLETEQVATSAARHREAIKGRCVTLSPAKDGLAWVSALLSDPDPAGVYDRTRQITHSLKQHMDENRNLGQLQADAVRDLLILGTTGNTNKDTSRQQNMASSSDTHAPADSVSGGFVSAVGYGIGAGVRANVTITVPAPSLLPGRPNGNVGHTPELYAPKLSVSGMLTKPEMLAELEGYGPIDIQTAAKLAGTSNTWRRILTDPVTNTRLAYDRKIYRPPEELRNYAKQQDQHCRFPGCNRPAKNCELDHVIDWQWDSPTDADNLASLCRSHHVLKHNSAWRVKHIGGRILKWTSPTGSTYITKPRFQEPNFTEPPDTPGRSDGPAPPF